MQRLPGRFNDGHLSDDQIDYILSKYLENKADKEELRKTFVAGLVARMEEEHFLLAPAGSPVIPYLMNEFATLELQDFIVIPDNTNQLYKTLFNSALPTDNESLKITAIKHLQAILPVVYVSKDANLKKKGAQKALSTGDGYDYKRTTP